MKRMLFLIIILLLPLSGCSFDEKIEIALSKVPSYTVINNKSYYEFSNTIAFNYKIYSITDTIVHIDEIENKIGKIERNVPSEASINGDNGFLIIAKSKEKSKLYINTAFQQVFNKVNRLNTYGNSIYKIKNMDTTKAIALRYSNNDYRKYVYIGEMNSFYRTINKIIKPIVFIPFLFIVYFAFLFYFAYLE